jgi:hypothetical protein
MEGDCREAEAAHGKGSALEEEEEEEGPCAGGTEAEAGDDDEMIRPPSPDLELEQLRFDTLPSPSMEGFLLKKCRRNGDERPWKRRW